MVTNTFINLATRDVTAARSFFTHLGMTINEQFSDPSGICVVVNPTTYLMVMNTEKFEGFTKAKTPDNTKETAVILSFQVESKEAVDQLLSRVVEKGGNEFGTASDNEFMYFCSFRDLDGHHFEVFYFK